LRVLVTGGAGFLGSHVVDALLARGDEVVVVDDLSTGDRANLDPRADLRVADVSDSAAFERALAGGERIDAVVHCAAKTKVVESMEKEDLYERVIVEGTYNALELARHGAKMFVNISTGGAIYGETPVCATEDDPIDPLSNYGRFKAKAERLVAASGLRSVTLRLANIYGPRQRTDLEGGVIAIFVGCWKRGDPITLYGDGSYERDYVYVAMSSNQCSPRSLETTSASSTSAPASPRASTSSWLRSPRSSGRRRASGRRRRDRPRCGAGASILRRPHAKGCGGRRPRWLRVFA
jgi:UDP-glucose 4-epimerase